MALALCSAHNAVLNKEKIRLRKNFCIQKKKRLLVQNHENAARIKEYNKKYFQIVNSSGGIVKKI